MRAASRGFIDSLDRLFGIDIRSLACMRAGLALLILTDLAMRARDLAAHYSDNGVLPRADFFAIGYGNWDVSIHMANGTVTFQALLFLLAALLAVSLLLGFRTRLVTILSWVMLISLNVRNPLLVTGADRLLIMLLFWCMFLPTGACWSIDHALNQSTIKAPRRILTLAGAGLLLQVALVYVFSGLIKAKSGSWHDGSAMFYALSLQQYAKPMADWLLQFPRLLSWSTVGVLWMEIGGGILFFLPFWTKLTRTILLAVFFVLQLSFFFTFHLGLFPFVSIVGLLCFLPSEFWEWQGKRGSRGDGIKIYYDGDCGFCLRMVHVLRELLILPKSEILPAQSEASVLTDMEKLNSWVLVEPGGKRHYHFDGITRLLAASPLLWPVSYITRIPPLHWVGMLNYKFIARNRRLADHWSSWLQFDDRPYRITKVNQLLAAAAIVLMIGTNFDSLRGAIRMPGNSRQWASLIWCNQNWGMFAGPRKYSGWFVAEGTLANGEIVDLLQDGAPRVWEKPESIAGMAPNHRWRRYWMRLRQRQHEDHRELCSEYLCRQWNTRHESEEELQELVLYFMREETHLDGVEQVEKKEFHRHNCRK